MFEYRSGSECRLHTGTANGVPEPHRLLPQLCEAQEVRRQLSGWPSVRAHSNFPQNSQGENPKHPNSYSQGKNKKKLASMVYGHD